MEEIGHHVLVLVTDGKVIYTINGVQIVAERGEFLYIPKSTMRCGENLPDRPHRKWTILFTAGHELETSVPFLKQQTFIRFRLANFQNVQRMFGRLYEEMRERRRFRSLICMGIMQELFGTLSRELEKPEVPPIKLKYAQIVKQHLLDRYREPVEIEQLARLINRSPNYTTALFKEVFGHSPIKYMHQLRVMEACNLLLYSDMTVASIAQYLGYYDPSYFFRMFKKHCAMSPTDFAERGQPSDLAGLFG